MVAVQGLPSFAEVDVILRDTSLEVGVTELVIDLLRVIVVTMPSREKPLLKIDIDVSLRQLCIPLLASTICR